MIISKNNIKELYESPELEISAYEAENILTASALGDNDLDIEDIWS